MTSCINHSELEAVEKCEVCQEPLCSLCLWYGEKGHRYCDTHAQAAKVASEQIYSPQTYAEGIPASLSRATAAVSGSPAGEKLYQGNQQDMYGFVAAALALISLASCFGGVYCLPFIGAILGGVAYFNADRSLDPKRTRLMGGIAMGVGGVAVAIILLFFIFYGAIFFTAFASGSFP